MSVSSSLAGKGGNTIGGRCGGRGRGRGGASIVASKAVGDITDPLANASTETKNIVQNSVGNTSHLDIQQVTDYTQYPIMLDKNYEKYDPDSALRPTIIKTGVVWTKKAQAALLTAASAKKLYVADQTTEKTAAFDLLDALSRSGSLCIDDASLHVVIAATHCFDKTLVNTVIQKNVNPIERVERSTLIMASTIHGVLVSDLVVGNQVNRLQGITPTLFLAE